MPAEPDVNVCTTLLSGRHLMATYIIIELPDGLEPIELVAGRTAEEVAEAEGGILVDEGPFASLDEAQDAIDNLEAEPEDER